MVVSAHKQCGICDLPEHSPRQAHWFDQSKAAKPVKMSDKPVTHKPVVNVVANADVVVNKTVANRSGDRHKDKSARRAYMREYMRNTYRPKKRSA